MEIMECGYLLIFIVDVCMNISYSCLLILGNVRFLYKMFYENINVIFVFLVNCGLFLKIKWVIIFKGYSFEGLICIYMC